MSKNTQTSGLVNYIAHSGSIVSVSGSLTVTGSLNVTGGMTGSFQGVATTASYVLNAVSASFATTASYAVSASIATNAVTASHALNAVSASFATTAVTSSFANAFTVAGTLTAQTLVVQTITSSVDFVTGSTRFGSLLANTHAFTGSVGMTGSLAVNGTTSTQLKYFLKESNTNAWSIYTDGANGPFYIKDEYNSGSRLTIGITGNIGINTASPTTKLTIDNSANANTNHIDLIGNSSAGAKGHLGSFGGGTYLTSNYYYASGQNNDTGSLGQGAVIIGTSATAGASSISFALSDPGATSPSTKVNILSNGNVGIGTTSPTGSLQIGDLQSGTNGSINGASGTIRRAIVNCPYPGASALTLGYYSLAYGIDIWVNGDGTGLAPVYFDQKQNEAIIFRRNTYGTAAESMRITGAGDVGIGTTSPSQLLDIVGTTPMINIQAGANNNARGIQFNYNGSFVIGSLINFGGTGENALSAGGTGTSGYFLTFKTDGTERMRITSGGEVQINGTTSASGVSKLTLRYDGTSNYPITAGNESATGGLIRFAGNGSGVLGSITHNGSNVAYNTSSDYRLKEDLKDYDGLNIVSKLKTYDFKWKKTSTRDYGMMAHELQEVLPHVVFGEKDAINEDDSIKPQAVDYSKLVPVLVKAIQELQTRITQLENK